MKFFIKLTILFYCFIFQNAFAELVSNEDDLSNQRFSSNQYGVGLSIAKEFNVIKDIFSEEENDYIFSDISLFYNLYQDDIENNYGASYAFGYGYKKFGFYLSAGYLITEFKYGLEDNIKNYAEDSGFVGSGFYYKITDNIKFKTDFMNYGFNFKPAIDNSSQKVQIDIRSLSAALQFYF